MTARWLFQALLACAPAACATAATNHRPAMHPAIGADFADPAVLRADDNYYYTYATQSERDGKLFNIQVARSRDRSVWEPLGDALPAKPAWASRTQDF